MLPLLLIKREDFFALHTDGGDGEIRTPVLSGFTTIQFTTIESIYPITKNEPSQPRFLLVVLYHDALAISRLAHSTAPLLVKKFL